MRSIGSVEYQRESSSDVELQIDFLLEIKLHITLSVILFHIWVM